MSDEIDTSAEAVERQGLIPRHTKLLLRALAAERDAERQRAEKAEAERDRLRSIIRTLLDADERGQGVAWQNAMDMAQHAIERGLDK